MNYLWRITGELGRKDARKYWPKQRHFRLFQKFNSVFHESILSKIIFHVTIYHMKSYQYKHAAVAGTFDHLHAGHKAILRFAFSLAKIVTVGIASEKLLSQKNLERQIESFSKRQQTLIGFLQSLKVLPRTEIIQINDIYGNAVNDKTLQAIVVTRETS